MGSPPQYFSQGHGEASRIFAYKRMTEPSYTISTYHPKVFWIKGCMFLKFFQFLFLIFVVFPSDGLQIWSAAGNILNKQSRRNEKGCSPSLEVVDGVNNSPLKKSTLLRNVSQGLGLGRNMV
jgi:hypothetical protein